MSFLSGFKQGTHNFGQNIAIIINTALLLFVYVVGVGITSIVAKLVGKKFMESELTDKKSYWNKFNLKKEKMENYYRQF